MAKTLLGIDIGTQSIKAVQILSDKEQYSLMAAGYIGTPLRSVGLQTSADEKIIGDAINRLVHDMKVTTVDVSASLPSYKVTTRVVEVPIMNESELSSSIQWEAEQYIPLPLAKVKIDYTIMSKDEERGKMKILMVAAPLNLIEKHMRIITLAGLNPVSLETEILAASRCIDVCFPTLSNIIILNIGANTTDLAVLHEHLLVYTKSLSLGGSSFTRAISQELGFEMAQAEEYKKTYGLEEDKLEGKIYNTIFPLFANIFSEIEKTASYFKEQYPKEELKTIVISGGEAKMPGLILAITRNLGLDSQIINPFANITVSPKILPVLAPEAPIYTISLGLALKEVENL